MSRKKSAEKRPLVNDPLYNSKKITQLVNCIMKAGKKTLAQRIVYKAFAIIKEKQVDKSPLNVFETALDNVMPQVELKTRRIGGANYQVPVEVSDERKIALAIRWLVNYSAARNGKSIIENLAHEILDAFINTGASVKKREEIHRMAEANKAFAHYRW